MRAEEKQVDDHDLQRAELKESLLEGEEKQLQQGLSNERQESAFDPQLLAAMRDIIEKKPVSARQLALPEREMQALEMLQTAVSARDTKNKWVYAEDRQQMLEQALAVLQPSLAGSNSALANEMRAGLSEMVGQVHDLRMELKSLEDAQEDMIGSMEAETTKAETDDEDKPDENTDEEAKPTSMFEGDQVERDEKPTTIWDDPDPFGIPAQKLKIIPVETPAFVPRSAPPGQHDEPPAKPKKPGSK